MHILSRDPRPKFTKFWEHVSIGQTPNHANFIALGQTVYEKSVTNFFYTLRYFGALGGTLGSKFTNLGDDV